MNISWFIKYFDFALHYYPETYIQQSRLGFQQNKLTSFPQRSEEIRRLQCHRRLVGVWSLWWWWIALKDDHEWDGYHISTRTIWSRRQLVSDERFLAMELANLEANYCIFDYWIKQISHMARQSYKKRDKSIWTSDHRHTQRTIDSCVLLNQTSKRKFCSALCTSVEFLSSVLFSDKW